VQHMPFALFLLVLASLNLFMRGSIRCSEHDRWNQRLEIRANGLYIELVQ
jgi:hypothetical protein